MLLLLILLQVSAPSCTDTADCRRLALEAASRGEAETFHDLAWRAVQKGKRNDPELMLILARAQSLSGRPGDALVMLTRITDLGVIPDVLTDPDFARVRALPGWSGLEARLTGKPPAAAPAPPPSASPAAAAAPPTPRSAPPEPSGPAPKPGNAAAPSAPATAPAEPGLAFAAPGVDVTGLAHDSVSRRFVLGDGTGPRLMIVDEASRNVVPYVRGASAGFFDQLAGFTIDARRGDLWVASTKGDDALAESILHKLQLVSGRTLQEVRPARDAGPVKLAAVAVAGDGTVYAVDERSSGARVFRLRPGARTLEPLMNLELKRPAGQRPAIAAADDGALFVSDAAGLIRVDPAARTAARVKSAEDLGGFESLAWRDGALLGIERVAASYLVVRVRLDGSGTRARPRQILAASPTPAVGTLAGDGFYYVAEDQIIRRVIVR
ncbi:MAG TPA: hypothetical protein VFK57_06950 [Vicinamibacterales bacterium]|nr:hypothetical protein [Vicinamibacterales bacterium]